MAKYKYQMLRYSLFDYRGVEEHLEKMAAKGWWFDSVGTFCWKFRKKDPAQIKCSVTYAPEFSEFASGLSEEQMEREAYCREAGWRKAGNWVQMQIFYSDSPDAVPIETDEGLRLDIIHKTMKKNFLVVNFLLLLILLFNAFTTYNLAKNNWIEALADGNWYWRCGLFLWGIFLTVFDLGYYLNWYRKARRAVQEGFPCPEPKFYRCVSRVAWYVLAVLAIGMFSSYSNGAMAFMMMYLAGLLIIMFLLRKVREYLKDWELSKGWNFVLFLIADVVFCVILMGGLTKLVMKFDWDMSKEPQIVDVYEIDGSPWAIYEEELPLYAEDFMDIDYTKRSCYAKETSSLFLEYGEYQQKLLSSVAKEPLVMYMKYQIITVKADFLYEFVADALYEKEFRYADAEEKEKTEYRLVCESENGRLYQKYYDGLPVAREWLVLSENKIVPITIYTKRLMIKQMEIIINKLTK